MALGADGNPMLLDGGEVGAVVAPEGFPGRAEDELALLLRPVDAPGKCERTEEERREARYLYPKRTGSVDVLRWSSDSVSITIQAAKNIATMARITSTVGFLSKFLILFQGVLPSLCVRMPGPYRACLYDRHLGNGFLPKV
jgi:hypothetical protein